MAKSEIFNRAVFKPIEMSQIEKNEPLYHWWNFEQWVKREKYDALQSEVEQLNNKLGHAENEVEQLNNKLGHAENEVEQLRDENELLTKSLESHSTDLKALAVQVDNQLNRINQSK